MSKADDFESYWIIFDISSQNWAVYPNKVDFGWNCCRGKLITVRGFHYFFHQLEYSDVNSSPINKILENGTVVDLNMDRPFEKEANTGLWHPKICFGAFLSEIYGNVLK